MPSKVCASQLYMKDLCIADVLIVQQGLRTGLQTACPPVFNDLLMHSVDVRSASAKVCSALLAALVGPGCFCLAPATECAFSLFLGHPITSPPWACVS